MYNIRIKLYLNKYKYLYVNTFIHKYNFIVVIKTNLYDINTI